MRTTAHLIIYSLLLLIVAGCTSQDCPLNNLVFCNYQLQGEVTTLPDTLTITAARMEGNDSVLINQQVNTDSFSLPMSYWQPEDVFFFQCNSIRDTVRVEKENHPHFESTDCGPNYFHTITRVRFTRNAIDTIVINNKEVTYDVTTKHLYIHFKKYRY